MADTSEILVKRLYLKEDYTIGKMYVDGNLFCDTLEDRVRDYNKDGDLLDSGEEKVYGQTAIPYGRYRITVTVSPKFRRELPRLLDVPHFTGILVHSGRHAGHTEGCVLVGENKIKGGLINGNIYVQELTSWIKIQEAMGKECYITIE